MTCWAKSATGWRRRGLLRAHQGELAHAPLQGGDDFLSRTLADALQAAERFQVARFDRSRDLADGKRHRLHGLQWADILHTDEMLEELLLDLMIEADENRFGLALGLLVVDMQGQLIAERSFRPGTP